MLFCFLITFKIHDILSDCPSNLATTLINEDLDNHKHMEVGTRGRNQIYHHQQQKVNLPHHYDQ